MSDRTASLNPLIFAWFGSDLGPIEFLLSHGFTIDPLDHGWLAPVPYHTISCYEAACILFLQKRFKIGAMSGRAETVPVRCLCGGSKDETHPCHWIIKVNDYVREYMDLMRAIEKGLDKRYRMC